MESHFSGKKGEMGTGCWFVLRAGLHGEAQHGKNPLNLTRLMTVDEMGEVSVSTQMPGEGLLGQTLLFLQFLRSILSKQQGGFVKS